MMSIEILFILVPVLLSIMVVEVFFAGSWGLVYHKNGIPLFRRTFSYSKTFVPETITPILSEQFKKPFHPPMVFRLLSPTHIMFREEIKLFHFYPSGYSPFMHGLIEIDPIQKKITIVGRIYWYLAGLALSWIISVILGWVLNGIDIGSLISLFLLLFISVALYGRAIRPYNQLITELRQRYGSDNEQKPVVEIMSEIEQEPSQTNWIVVQIIIVVIAVAFFGIAFSGGAGNLPFIAIMAIAIVGAVFGSLLAVITRGIWGIIVRRSVWDGRWTMWGTIIGAILGAIIAGVSIAIVGI